MGPVLNEEQVKKNFANTNAVRPNTDHSNVLVNSSTAVAQPDKQPDTLVNVAF